MNEQALKERIKYIAHSENRKFNQVWRDLILERLLIRLARSSYSDQFVFLKEDFCFLITLSLVVKQKIWIYKPHSWIWIF